MFARTLVAIFLGVAAVQVSAAPLGSRQLGNLECNVDRLEIVTGLSKTQSTLKDLATAMADDDTASTTIQNTADSISTAQDAIGTIGKALITFQKAPPEARQTVLDSLNAATESLGSLTSDDENTAATIKQAQAELEQSLAAGNGVVANCK